MLGIVVLALASSGGGDKKRTAANLGIIPIRANGTFLNAKPGYSGSHILHTVNKRNYTVYKSVVTYQNGNTTYIVPSQFRMNNNPTITFNPGLSLRSNMNVIDLKIRLCK